MSKGVRGPRRGAPAKCRSCDRPLNSPLFCADCHTLHEAEGCDYFELLGFEPSYDVRRAELRQRYLQASREVHPDRHGDCPADAALSLRASARLNEAYRVLADPALRAEYLLELAGGKSSADDKGVADGVLAQTLAWQEELAEAKAAGEPGRLAECRRQVQSRLDEALGVVAQLARELPGSEETRGRLRQTLNALKYCQKLLTQM
jgi:molecular chaperone HscB